MNHPRRTPHREARARPSDAEPTVRFEEKPLIAQIMKIASHIGPIMSSTRVHIWVFLVYIIGAVKASILVAILFTSAASAQLANSCDRTCMTNLVDRYLAAMVKHDPSGLPLAKGVRYTENTAEIQVGEGLWVGASEAPTTFKM